MKDETCVRIIVLRDLEIEVVGNGDLSIDLENGAEVGGNRSCGEYAGGLPPSADL